MKKVNTSKYLARIKDGAILKENKDGTFSFINTGMFNPYRYDKSKLLSSGDFEEITKKDFPKMKIRENEYFAWLSWSSRSDGHGGEKSGTIEEFRKLPNYKKMIGEE